MTVTYHPDALVNFQVIKAMRGWILHKYAADNSSAEPDLYAFSSWDELIGWLGEQAVPRDLPFQNPNDPAP